MITKKPLFRSGLLSLAPLALLLAFNLTADNVNAQSDRDYDRDRDNSTSQSKRITITSQEIVISTDTILRLKMEDRLSSATAKVGDRFSAVLAQDFDVDGVRVLPAGARVEGRVNRVEPARRGSKAGLIGIEFDKMTLPSGRAIPIVGELTSLDPGERRQIDQEGRVEGGSSAKRNVVFIGGGAAGGAAIGAIAGGAKGAGIGAAVGAGVGVLGAVLAKGEEAVVESGTEFGLLLTEPLRIPNAGYGDSSDRGSTGGDPTDFTEDDYAIVYSDADTIERAQSKLRELGYLRSASNGRFNSATRRALTRFQSDNGLRQTGQVDYPTAAKLGII